MIVNTTFKNDEIKKLINSYLGNSFSLLDRIKMNGIGSKRMMIAHTSPTFQAYLNKVSDINYANIELRPKGILVHINQQLKNFSWIIPYYKLHIYNANYFSIHAEGNFIRFRKNRLYVENKKFIEKLMATKNSFLNTDYYGV